MLTCIPLALCLTLLPRGSNKAEMKESVQNSAVRDNTLEQEVIGSIIFAHVKIDILFTRSYLRKFRSDINQICHSGSLLSRKIVNSSLVSLAYRTKCVPGSIFASN